MAQPAAAHLVVRIEVHVDILCEWCYLTKRSLESAIRQQKMKQPGIVFDVRWRPFYRFPVLKTGVDKMVLYGGSHVGVGLDLGFGPGAAPETAARVRALGARHGIDFGAATGRTGPSRNAHKLAAQVLHHRGPEAQGQVLEALFRGHFEGAGDVSDAAWLVEIGTAIGGLAPGDVHGALLNDVAGWVVDEEVRAGQVHDGVEAVPCVTVQGRYRLGGYQDEAVFEDVFDKVWRDWQLGTGQ